MSFSIFILLVLTIAIPFGAFLKSARKQENFRLALAVNIISFFAVLICGTVLAFTGNAAAAETAPAVAGAASSSGLGYIAAGLSTGLSCIGAGIAISAAASSAIGALSENEGLMGKALIFVALGEGVAIYGLIISIMILGKV